MSHRQFGTLRYIDNHDISIEYVKMLNLSTFGSLWTRKWITKTGSNKIVLTRNGKQALDQYSRALPSYRKTSGEITERVRLMLHIHQLKHDTKTA